MLHASFQLRPWPLMRQKQRSTSKIARICQWRRQLHPVQLQNVMDLERLRRMVRRSAKAANWQEILDTP